MKDLELICFQIISAVGSARSSYIEAIQEAKNGNFEKAESLVEAGNKDFIEGHKVHAELIQKEAQDEKLDINLLLIHAEDQLMSAEAFKILSVEFIDMYQRFGGEKR